MPPRVRGEEHRRKAPLATLKYPCRMCEAEFPNREALLSHINFLHGQVRFYSTWLYEVYSKSPYVVNSTEKRSCVEHFAAAQRGGPLIPEDEAYTDFTDQAVQRKQLWAYLYGILNPDANPTMQAAATSWAGATPAAPEGRAFDTRISPTRIEERGFAACVFCAMLHWTENLARLYLTGPECTMKNPSAVADLLSADWYSDQWPLIPKAELLASAVEFPYQAEDESWTTKKCLMHKRRVTEDHLSGAAPALVCNDCHEAFWAAQPTLSKWSLANYNWLGRHPPIFRDATLGHQLLLALGRVVSTKVYLSSKGVDVVSRQHHQSWRKKFLQQGMSGTAIVYGNGSADDAMESFPPDDSVLQDSFMAVFSGPETAVILTPKEQEEQAKAALRKEVELHVCKATYEEQAALLMRTNYVYAKHKHGYKQHLVDKLPDAPALPSCFEACAKFIPHRSEEVDATKAIGPSNSTTAAQHELDAAEQDAEELDKWLSLMEDDHDEIAEMTSLPSLQGMLERMESMAGRIVANELLAVAEEDGYGAMDELGRERLRKICQEFHQTCAKVNRAQEVENLHWRVQAIAAGTDYGEDYCAGEHKTEDDAGVVSRGSSAGAATSAEEPKRIAQLRVPTSRKPCSWWSPEFWSIARPTDFCYGDCVWGFFALQPVSLKIPDWITRLWRVEEAECDVEEGEDYEAAPINRFGRSWYDLHILASFWRVTETTSSVHTFLKTPGAFGYTSSCAQVTPKMLEETMLRSEQCSKGKTSIHSILADKDLPSQLRSALTSLHQATASLVGSDGHRKLLQREGVAYTLRYGPALVFNTPNLADNKQPLLLIVQGVPVDLDADIANSYREMTERLAGDPVGQAIVFELMISLFFSCVLGVRSEQVGWRRGDVAKATSMWTSDGVAADITRPWCFGPVAAAFGPVEAQGRGSLHPHILLWLLMTELNDLLVWLARDRSVFKERLNRWMRELIASVGYCLCITRELTSVLSYPPPLGRTRFNNNQIILLQVVDVEYPISCVRCPILAAHACEDLHLRIVHNFQQGSPADACVQ